MSVYESVQSSITRKLNAKTRFKELTDLPAIHDIPKAKLVPMSRHITITVKLKQPFSIPGLLSIVAPRVSYHGHHVSADRAKSLSGTRVDDMSAVVDGEGLRFDAEERLVVGEGDVGAAGYEFAFDAEGDWVLGDIGWEEGDAGSVEGL